MMKSIRLICVLLTAIILESVLGVVIGAENDSAHYEQLLKEKKAYIDREYADYLKGEYGAENYFWFPLISPPLRVLLYTDAGKNLTIIKNTEEEYHDGVDNSLFTFDSGCLISPEINKATEACRTLPYTVRESVSGLRECIRYFGITKEELLAGFKLMKEDPDAIRPLLPMLTDREYESAR